VDNSTFISYRRSVSEFVARAVFQDLRANDVNVFMDVESIDAGDFASIILNQIAARPYFLVILAPGTLDRCSEEGDWLRREIEHAMDQQRIIIPVMTSNFSFEAAEKHLTGKLTVLQRYQALSIPHDYFEAAMERLRTRYLKPVSLTTKPTPASEKGIVQRKIEQADATPTVTERQLSAQDYFEQALINYMKNNKDEAVVNYRKALRLNPKFGEAYCALGLAYRDQGKVADAMESFYAALELLPDHPLATEMRNYISSQRKHLWQDPPMMVSPAPNAP
jgi:tetratricopeptide (TPR) repeat protein